MVDFVWSHQTQIVVGYPLAGKTLPLVTAGSAETFEKVDSVDDLLIKYQLSI